MTETEKQADMLLAVAHRNFLDCAFRVQQIREAIGSRDGDRAATAAEALNESAETAWIAINKFAEVIHADRAGTRRGLEAAGFTAPGRPN